MSDATQFHMPPCACPYCGHNLDAATGNYTPTSGDISLCWKCLGELVFNDDLTLRKLTAAERDRMQPADRARIDSYKNALAAMRAGRN